MALCLEGLSPQINQGGREKNEAGGGREVRKGIRLGKRGYSKLPLLCDHWSNKGRTGGRPGRFRSKEAELVEKGGTDGVETAGRDIFGLRERGRGEDGHGERRTRHAWAQ
jgi:hypothetical protein